MQPLVSIIIPTYNRCHLIGETLDSIIAQTYSNWECIVVDDGSIDHTRKLLEFYSQTDSRIQFHQRPKNRPKGANACRNYGFEVSKGKYINWFDSDDLMNNKYCEKAVFTLGMNKEIDFVFFNYKVFEQEKSNIIFEQENSSKKALEDYFSGKINFSTCGIVWKRQSISSVSYNEKLNKSQELNFIFNNYKETKGRLSGEFIDYCAYYLRKHESSIVSLFKLSHPEFLFSDMYVRNEITNYFNRQKHPSICNYQRKELTRSLYKFFEKSEIAGILKIFYNQLSWYEFLSLVFYRAVYKLTGRDHRLKKVLKCLSNKNYTFNLA